MKNKCEVCSKKINGEVFYPISMNTGNKLDAPCCSRECKREYEKYGDYSDDM